jgi:hypothetical protein
VPAAWVVPAFDELEDRHARLGLGTERTPVDELALQRGEKLSAMALSKQSPADPVEGSTPISRHRLPKASEVYCVPRSE